MTTKLNYWRYLPPAAHGGKLVFLLITPVGGFHWLPLADTPRPRQAWKRGDELQGKKILSYEEGGSNGLDGEDRLSSIALVLTTFEDSVEAWCVPVFGNSTSLCVATNILGGALFCTTSMLSLKRAFDPLVVLVTNSEGGSIAIEVFEIMNSPFEKQKICIKDIDIFEEDDIVYEIPTLAMGASPSALCLCWKDFIVIIFRDRGLLLYYKFVENKINQVAKHRFERFVVDAGIQTNDDGTGVVVAALLCEPNKKDGHIAKIHLT